MVNPTRNISDSQDWAALVVWNSALPCLLMSIAFGGKILGYFAKFGMVEGFLVLSIVTYCKLAGNTIASKVSLLVATISPGVLLALY